MLVTGIMTRDNLPHQIGLALERLNDLGALMALDLTLELAGEGQAPDLAARELRAELLDAIESLHPPQNLPTRSRAARSYVLLYSRYVQEMTTEEVLDLLAISLRQYRREHRKALDTITEIMVGRLQERLGPGNAITPANELSEAVQQETWALAQRAEVVLVDVGELLRETISLMRPVAKAHGVVLRNGIRENEDSRVGDRYHFSPDPHQHPFVCSPAGNLWSGNGECSRPIWGDRGDQRRALA